MSRPVFSALLALVLAAPAVAQNTPIPLSTPLPVDPAVTIGTLPNGMRYYIRQNAKPEDRAELRLVVNAGSVLEDQDQLGLAHFLEHTAFNGTTNFKKNDLVSYLESIGVRFGADLNAYTGFDETVYILPVPTDSAHIVEKAFQILEDWAHGQLFDPTEVTNERGVVVEEWRGRKGAGDRMLQKWLPVALKGSLYATRLPVGTQESIMGATPDKLRRFYQDWYRPDLMSVIAVGDFDKAAIEALIKKHFSAIPKRANARPRPSVTVPSNVQPLVAITTDKEQPGTSVSLTFKMPHEQTRTVADYRRDLTQNLYLGMLNNRFSEIGQKPNAPFLAAGASVSSFFARDIDAFSLDANVADNGIEKATEALLAEARRVDQFGFLETELSRAKQNMLRGYERAYTERDKTQSGQLVEEYVGNYLFNEAIPGIEYEYRLVQQLLPGITLADVNALASKYITDENRVILVQAPDKPGSKVPTEAELLAVIDRGANATVTAWTETVTDAPLIERMPARGRVVSERMIPEVGVTEWKLSNGARVLLKPTDFKQDEVLMSGYSPGGHSLVSDADFMSATLASQVVELSGIGTFSAVELGKKLAGKVARVTASVGETSESISAAGSPKDLETMLQLVYLKFTAPRLDSAAYAAFTGMAKNQLANRGAQPMQVFFDSVTVVMGQHHFRSRPLTEAVFAEVNPNRALEIYRDRFADAGDFTFVFVGNIDPTTLKPLVEQYLAALPTKGRKETWKDVTPGSPRGVVTKTVLKGREPKAMSILTFSGPFTNSPENRFAIRALIDLFQIKATEMLREQLGGTYSPSVMGGGSKAPDSEYDVTVMFESAPENVEKLTAGVFTLIDSLQSRGPTQADVDKIRETMIRTRETSLKTNGYWVSNIAARDEAGEDLAGLLAAYDAMIRNLTPAQIQAAARLYLDKKNYARFLLLPEPVQ